MTEKFINTKFGIKEDKNNEKSDLTTEVASGEDWNEYKKIWLEAMENEPLAYWITKDNLEKTNEKTEEEWRNDLRDPNSVILLSKNNNIPIGMAQALLKTEAENKWGIRRVYLNKDFRGSGFGEKIMNQLLDEIRKRGGKKAVLNVVDTQEAAKKMYEKLGFKTFEKFNSQSIDKIKYPSGQWMEKEI